jgi:hypothetical protein
VHFEGDLDFFVDACLVLNFRCCSRVHLLSIGFLLAFC